METIDVAALAIKNGHTVLDLGCGEGRHAIALSHHFPEANIYALDINFQNVATALNKHTEFLAGDLNTLYTQADAFTLPFSDHSIDHIICSEVLEHIDHYEAIVEEISRVLKPGGSLNISVPRAWPEKICWALSKEYSNTAGGHVRIFNARQLTSQLTNREYIFLHRHWAHALHSPYWWLRCLFWRETDPQNIFVRWYHKLLVWDLLKKPILTRKLEQFLNPILGKSVVLYFKKANHL